MQYLLCWLQLIYNSLTSAVLTHKIINVSLSRLRLQVSSLPRDILRAGAHFGNSICINWRHFFSNARNSEELYPPAQN